MDGRHLSPLARFLIGAACIVIIVAGMKAAADLVNAFLLAAVITVSVSPILHWLKTKGAPEKLAAFIMIIIVLLAVVVLLMVVFMSITNLAETFPVYRPRVEQFKSTIDEWLMARGINIAETLELEEFEPDRIIGIAVKSLLYVRNAVSGWALMILLVVFMLGEAAGYPQKALSIIQHDSPTMERVFVLNHDIRHYMGIMTWSGLIMAIANVVLLILAGIPFAPLWGALSFFMAYVPAIGFIVSLVPPTVLAFLAHGGREALIVILGYIAIKAFVFSVLKPIFAGKSLNLSQLAIIVSVVVWVWVLGPIGAILAVPMTMIMKELLLESSAEGHLLANLMTADPRVESAPDDQSNTNV